MKKILIISLDKFWEKTKPYKGWATIAGNITIFHMGGCSRSNHPLPPPPARIGLMHQKRNVVLCATKHTRHMFKNDSVNLREGGTCS